MKEDEAQTIASTIRAMAHDDLVNATDRADRHERDLVDLLKPVIVWFPSEIEKGTVSFDLQGEHMARKCVDVLICLSQWFQVEPRPDDLWEISINSDGGTSGILDSLIDTGIPITVKEKA